MENILKEPVELRLAKAKSKDTDPEILETLSHDSFWFVRDFVASNLNTPRSSLEELIKDADFRVQTDAQKTLRLTKSRNEQER